MRARDSGSILAEAAAEADVCLWQLCLCLCVAHVNTAQDEEARSLDTILAEETAEADALAAVAACEARDMCEWVANRQPRNKVVVVLLRTRRLGANAA